MSRLATLSSEMLRGVFAQETGICPVFLITLAHSTLSSDIFISSDPTVRLSETALDVVYGTVSRGKEYLFYPFRLTLPSDEDSGPQPMNLEIDNVSLALMKIIRTITTPPTLTVEIVLSSSPDTVELTWPEYLLSNIKYDVNTITGTLVLETLTREPFPALAFTPGYFPALF
ncbi:hypothetical protein UFOVP1299_43 [uncultured Caudovirales phage]|uniref:DUF1833 domain-containing protein n=1 Tax=uncultured Caudovirales phage TaxID=2100421 RepID=A0A6J5RIX5_9CAUD|nr:hypothetical protein UFOVP1299_43 [uncultured Caudovirales phage]